MIAPNSLPSLCAVPVEQRSLTRRLASASASELPAAIAEAIAETTKAMMRAEPERIIHRVAILLADYWQPDEPPAFLDARLAQWGRVLEVFPEWAIEAAILDWQRCGTPGRPTPAAIARLCQRQVRPVLEELTKARAALARSTAPAPARRTPEQRARVAAMVAAATRRLAQ